MAFDSAESSTRPTQAHLSISFLIIGGGIAGLSCALALRRVGHHVRVLERSSRQAARGESGIRLPPNLTKIFFHWDLYKPLKQKALVSHCIRFAKYENGDYLGRQVWDQDLLRETRGVFMLLTHAELYDILYDAATRAGAEVEFNSEVVEMDTEEREVTLSSGTTLSADVLVGADGEYGPCRAAVLGQKVRGNPTGLALYDTIVPSNHLPEYLREVKTENGVLVAFGDNRAILGFPVHGGNDFVFQFYGPDEAAEGKFGDAPSVPVPSISEAVDPRFHEVTKNASKATRITIRENNDLEDWVEDEGRLVLVGEAAHPFPPGTIQATAMAVEDGAVLAKLFSHLTEERQIESFLYAYQELRQARTRGVRASEFGNAFFMAMADCDASRQRDAGMRALGAQGVNVLEAGGEASGLWDEIREIFGYDCEDEADDWWVQWGLLRERALGRQQGDEDDEDDEDEDEDEENAHHPAPFLNFAGLSVQTQFEGPAATSASRSTQVY